MGDRKRILLTGASGYIGRAVLKQLLAATDADAGEGYVLSRSAAGTADSGLGTASASTLNSPAGSPESLRASAADLRALLPPERILSCDLLDRDALTAALAPLAGKIDVIIHCAAATDNSQLSRTAAPSGAAATDNSQLSRTAASSDPNQAMIANLLKATEPEPGGTAPRWIHLSSVSVYGDAGRADATRPDVRLRPSGAYGRSKLACERSLIRAPGLDDLRILRVTPVFSPEALRNVAVRVCLPGTSLPLRIWPEPRHSLLSLSVLVRAIVAHVNDVTARRTMENLTDSKPYGQHSLIADCGKGFALPILEYIFRPIYWGCFLIPRGVGYHLRCFYWKLFRSNVYAEGQFPLPARET